MNRDVRLTVGMAEGALAFCREHSDGDPAIAPVADRLGILVRRSTDLLEQHRRSSTAVVTAIDDKVSLRVAVEEGLAALGGIGRTASKTVPGITVHRKVPRPHASELTLVTNARVAVGEAAALKEKLVPFGLDDGLLQSMQVDVEAFSAAMARQRKALRDQVGAAEELRSVKSEILSVVKNLDALYRVRFRNNAELRRAWKTARNVGWVSPGKEPPAPDPAPTPVPPTASDGAHAA
jgi:hypothetical protein